jgi:hypothetical protein
MKILDAKNIPPGGVRVFLDDEDISNKCFYAEAPDAPFVNGEGLVKVYIGKNTSVKGIPAFTIDATSTGELKTETLQGLVRWEPKQ